jgi:hypothetical protein
MRTLGAILTGVHKPKQTPAPEPKHQAASKRQAAPTPILYHPKPNVPGIIPGMPGENP